LHNSETFLREHGRNYKRMDTEKLPLTCTNVRFTLPRGVSHG